MNNEVQRKTQPCEDKTKSIIQVPEDPYNPNNNIVLIRYNRTLLFPFTRWIQMNRGKKITHKMKDEFKMLSLKISEKWITSKEPHWKEVWTHIVRPIKNTILHLWDVQGELSSWLAKKMCKILTGSKTTAEMLPKADKDAHNRFKNYTGMKSLDMVSANTESALIGLKKEYTKEEINNAKNNVKIDYDHDLEQYLNLH